MTKLSSNGKDQIVRFVRDGELLGYRSVIGEELTSLSVTALEDMSACFISKEEIFKMLRSNPDFSLDIFNQFISEKFQQKTLPLKSLGGITAPHFNVSQSELDTLISEFIRSLPATYSLTQLLTLFDTSRDELEDLYRNILRGAKLGEIEGGYKLKGRFRHVYTECQRVETAINYLQNDEKVKLGNLLNASHKSLADDYEVSTPEVDSIHYLLNQFGAYGSRIVGAGFGGMVLAISDHSQSDELIEKMKDSFYSKKISQNLDKYVIRCNTADGAGLI